MRLHTTTRRKINLNLTSLIDVLFILIIFFTVSSTFLEQPGIELKIPEAVSSESHTAQKIIVYIEKDETTFLNDEQVEFKQLVPAVKKLIEAQTDKSVVVRADADVHHGFVIKLMDELRKNGIYKVVISTVKPVQNQ